MRQVRSEAARTPWRWYPLGLTGAMLLVFAVNGVMVYDALRSFPGTAGEDGFDLSNSYNRVLDAAARQQALGWQVTARLDGAHRPRLVAVDRSGAPLGAVAVQAAAERPVGPPEHTELHFTGRGAGRFVAAETLGRGQWVVTVTIRRDGQAMSTTARLVVP
ncbi:MAG TPA: FixH family protein [Acetobacteraceae bacterium]|nr:FixH family protein [Acetobacteraceae bacterium]